jgi:hypothetical protein
MLPHDLFQPGRDFIQGLLPGDALKSVSHAFEGVFQPLRVVLEIGNVDALPADIPPGSGVFFITPDLEDPAALGGHFQAAVTEAEHARSLLPFAHGWLLGGGFPCRERIEREGGRSQCGMRSSECGIINLSLSVPSGEEKKNITTEHGEIAEIFLNKGHRHKSFFEYFIISAPSAVYHYFFMNASSVFIRVHPRPIKFLVFGPFLI